MNNYLFWKRFAQGKLKTHVSSVKIRIPSPKEILSWSERRLPNSTLVGKIDNAHTVEHDTLRPVSGGLFCERIFGPISTNVCACLRRKGWNEDYCKICEVQFTKSRLRRYQMGHILLAAPVIHIWALQGGYLSNLLGKKNLGIRSIAYGKVMCQSKLWDKTVIDLPYIVHDFSRSKNLFECNRFSFGHSYCSDYELGTNTTYGRSVEDRPSFCSNNWNKRSIVSFAVGTKGFASSRSVGTKNHERSPLFQPRGSLFQPYLRSVGTKSEARRSIDSNRSTRGIDTNLKNNVQRAYERGNVLPFHQFILYKPDTFNKITQFFNSLDKKETKFPLPLPCYSKKKLIFYSNKIIKKTHNTTQSYSKSLFLKPNISVDSVLSTICVKGGYLATSFAVGTKGFARNSKLFSTNYLYERSTVKTKNFVPTYDERSLSPCNYVFGTKSLPTMLLPLRAKLFVPTAKLFVRAKLTSWQLGWNKELLTYGLYLRSSYNKNIVLGAKLLGTVARASTGLALFDKHFALPTAAQLEHKYVPSIRKEYSIDPLITKTILSPTAITNIMQPNRGDTIRDFGIFNQTDIISWGVFCFYDEYKFSSKISPWNKEPYPTYYENAAKSSLFERSCATEGSKSRAVEQRASNYVTRSRLEQRASRLEQRASLVVVEARSSSHFNNRVFTRTNLKNGPIASLDNLRKIVNRTGGFCGFSGTNGIKKSRFNKLIKSKPLLTDIKNVAYTGSSVIFQSLKNFNLVLLDSLINWRLKKSKTQLDCFLLQNKLTKKKRNLRNKLAKSKIILTKRKNLVQSFLNTKQLAEWMIISILPILPPALRPILELEPNNVVVSDLNVLYQTVIRRNDALMGLLTFRALEIDVLNRQVSLQQAIEKLFDKGAGTKKRPVKSLSQGFHGKKGLFRSHLLGKRVDYSGRSVIVVGPQLKLHECGLPKEMALILFLPFLIARLKKRKIVNNTSQAKQLILQKDKQIWSHLKLLIYEHPVLLNRAPTLHRLGFQAFQPILVSGKAMILPALVCTGFNADFDGDQMAVHVPLSHAARAESWKLLHAKNNMLSPATGKPIIVLSQEMILGCYCSSLIWNNSFKKRKQTDSKNPATSKLQPTKTYEVGAKSLPTTSEGLLFQPLNANLKIKQFLNKTSITRKKNNFYFTSFQEIYKALGQNKISIQTAVWLRIPFFEDNQFLEEPLEIRLDAKGHFFRSYCQSQRHFLRNIKSQNQLQGISYIRTSAGRIQLNETFYSSWS